MQIHARISTDEVLKLAVVGDRWGPPDDSEIVDLTGLWAIEGLADAHAHLSADVMGFDPAEPTDVRRRLAAAVAGGVFLCLDKGWCDDVVLRIGSEPGWPQVEAAGRMIAGVDGYYPGFAEEVDDTGLVAAVSARVGQSGRWVKIVGDWPRRDGPAPRFTQEALAKAVEVAHAAGARVALHTMAPEMATMAVSAGVDSIEHGLYLTADDLAALAGRDGVWVPTVLRMEEVLASMRPGSTGASVVGAGLDNVSRLLPLAAEMGVTVLAGTDLAVPTARVGAEAAALARRGLPAPLAAAACGAAVRRSVGRPSGFEVGTPADLVAFARDPVADPSVLADPVVVVHRGTVVTDRR